MDWLMRKSFIKTLVKLAENDECIYLITADMGYGLVEPFAQNYPKRFINVGVAEQNMIGVAAGLALMGKIVFVYSIVGFPTMRCYEQIRNDVCYHNLRVHIVAGSTGLTYGALGSSHHATEDIAIMRALPNMTVIAPGNLVDTALATKAIAKYDKPCYLRLGNSDDYENCKEFKLGKATLISGGQDVALIATGSMVATALKVNERLNKIGIYPIIMDMHTIKPIDEMAIKNVVHMVHSIITIEEHSIVGGLGSAVSEVLTDNNIYVRLKRMALRDEFCIKVANQQDLLKDNGLTEDDIIREVLSCQNGVACI
jgi:transketolase